MKLRTWVAIGGVLFGAYRAYRAGRRTIKSGRKTLKHGLKRAAKAI